MENFRTVNIAVEFYQMCHTFKLTGDARNQLDRAARSIALNLGEGRGRKTRKDQKRFFQIAFGSLRECQTLLRLERLEGIEAWQVLDKLGAHVIQITSKSLRALFFPLSAIIFQLTETDKTDEQHQILGLLRERKLFHQFQMPSSLRFKRRCS